MDEKLRALAESSSVPPGELSGFLRELVDRAVLESSVALLGEFVQALKSPAPSMLSLRVAEARRKR